MESHDPPVIRIVKKGHGHAHHGGAWKVAFADFVTAMMALFIVLWILNQSEDVKRGIGGYFRDPSGKALLGAGPSENTSRDKIVGRSIVDIPTLYKRHADPQQHMVEEAQRLQDIIKQEEVLGAMGDQISVEVTAEGVRVEITENDKSPLFESGSAQLSEKLITALQRLAIEFAKQPNPITIEGHTDARPFSSASGMNNWELSSQRANEARHVIEAAGVPVQQIFMIRGFADRVPKFPDPMDARNRRISLLIMSEQGLAMAEGRDYHQPASMDAKPAVSLRLGGGN